MTGHRAFSAEVRQTTRPDWRPLVRLLGERLAGSFMWMYELVSDEGWPVQVYKHRAACAYLHLGGSGETFAYTAAHDGRAYVSVDPVHAITHVFSRWSVLDASPEEVRDLHAAVRAAHREASHGGA